MGQAASCSYIQHHFNFNFQYNFSKVYTEYIFNVNCEHFKLCIWKLVNFKFITIKINGSLF